MNKRLLALIVTTIMLTIMIPAEMTVFAGDTIIFEDTFNNTYANDGLDINWWGNPSTDSRYAAGERWAINYGGVGSYRDAEDGSLAVIRGIGSDGKPLGKNGETQTFKKIIANTIADNSTLEITYDFKTPEEAPINSGANIWFCFRTANPNGTGTILWSPFMLKILETGIEHGWAVTEFYPKGQKSVICKNLDRDPNNISFDWGKEYTVKITIKPTEGSEYYRFVTEVYADGAKIGTGIINEWSQITSDVIKNFSNAYLNVITTDSISVDQEPEDLLYLKGIKVKAIQPETAINAVYFPENGTVDATVDTECYVDFESPVEPVTLEQVSVSGGEASVADVAMSNDDKKVNIQLDGVKANTAYTIEIKNVKGISSESSFDYKWSFTTSSGIEFGEPYFGSSETVLDVSMKELNLATVGETTTDNDEFLAGNVWAHSTTRAGINSAFTIDGDYLWARAYSVNSNNRLYKKINPISDNSSMTFTGTIRTSKFGGNDADVTLLLANADESLTISVLRLYRQWNGYWASAGGINVGAGAWSQETGTLFMSSNWHTDLSNSPFYKGADIPFTFTMTPNKSDSTIYNINVTTGVNGACVANTVQISAEQAKSIDRVVIRNTNNNSTETGNFMGFKDMKIVNSIGKSYPTVGTNVINIDYTNMSGDTFDADVLIVEREAETNKLIDATVIKKENIVGDAGSLNCEFEIQQAGSKLDIYVLNSADGMILLSNGKTFDVET